MAQLVPDIKKKVQDDWIGKHLYSVAKHIGCTYLASKQSTLATYGGKINDNGLESSNGICGGLVLEWARQSYADGTPHYPTFSSIESQRSQSTQHDLKDTHLTLHGHHRNQLIADMDLEKYIDDLDESNIYYISTHNGQNGGGHAYGIRKNSANNIEIFDPNYGYFFFRDSKTASTWLATLFQLYQATNFPCKRITTYTYRPVDKTTRLENNIFPDKRLADYNVIKGQKENYYKKMLVVFETQVYYIRKLSKNGYSVKAIDIIMSAIRHYSKLLNEKEYTDIVSMLESAENNDFKCNTIFTMLQSELNKVFNEDAVYFTRKISATIKIVKNEKNNAAPVDAGKMELLNKAIIIQAEITKKIAALSQMIYEAKIITPLDPELKEAIRKRRRPHEDDENDAAYAQINKPYKADTLRLQIKLLTRRQQALRESDFTTKLTASAKGQHDYTLQEAQAEFQNLFGINDQELDSKNIVSDYFAKTVTDNLGDQHIALLAQLQKLISVLNATDDNLRCSESHKYGLLEIQDKKFIAAQRRLIETYLNAIDEFKGDLLVLDENEKQNRLQQLVRQVIPQGLTLADMDKDSSIVRHTLCDYFRLSIKSKIYTRITFSSQDLSLLGNVYYQLNYDNVGTFSHFLKNKLLDHDLPKNKRAGIENLINKISYLRYAITDAVDPNGALAKNHHTSSEDFLNAVKISLCDLLPNWNPASPHNMTFSPADYEHYLNLVDFPAMANHAINQTGDDDLSPTKKDRLRGEVNAIERGFIQNPSIPQLYKNAKAILKAADDIRPKQLLNETFISQSIVNNEDLKNFIEAIYDRVSKRDWKKHAKFNNKDAPDGVLALRQHFAAINYVKEPLIPIINDYDFNTYKRLMKTIEQTANDRLNKSRPWFKLYTGYDNRATETDALYRLCRAVGNNLKQHKPLYLGCECYLRELGMLQPNPVRAASIGAIN